MAKFRPPLWAVALTAFGVVLFSALGVWQLRRADEKRAYFAAFDAPPGAQIVDHAVGNSQALSMAFAFIRLSGRYDGARQILLDARVRDGRNGYEVLTPLRTADGNVLINRGWVAAPEKRNSLPEIAIGDSERTISGRLLRLPIPGMRSAAAASDDGWPRRLLFPTAAEISEALGYPVRDYQVLLGPTEPDGFVRDWRPAVMQPDQHLAYAMQWFALAITVTIIFFLRNLKRTDPK
jgi:surfeit locus 1 family protein